MRFAMLGTGIVGTTLGSALVARGHEVRMGSRTATNPSAAEWLRSTPPGAGASQGTFADAAAFGEIVLNCTSGGASLAALEAAGRDNLRGKILIDVANPLDFSKGMPPTLSVSNTDSLGEQIQRALPETRNCFVMLDPSRVPGDHVRLRQRQRRGREADGRRRPGRLVRLGAAQRRRPRRHHDGARYRDVPVALGATHARARHGGLQREHRAGESCRRHGQSGRDGALTRDVRAAAADHSFARSRALSRAFLEVGGP